MCFEDVLDLQSLLSNSYGVFQMKGVIRTEIPGRAPTFLLLKEAIIHLMEGNFFPGYSHWQPVSEGSKSRKPVVQTQSKHNQE